MSRMLLETVSMIGTPDDYYDADERKSAHSDMMKAMESARNNYEEEDIARGICTACGGNGYMDGDYEVWDEDEDDYVENSECDGTWHYGCDQGEMVGASWVEIINHDKRVKEREISRSNFDKEKAIQGISRYVKYMDDPRLCGQQVKIDYPHLGRHEISELVSAGMRKAGLL